MRLRQGVHVPDERREPVHRRGRHEREAALHDPRAVRRGLRRAEPPPAPRHRLEEQHVRVEAGERRIWRQLERPQVVREDEPAPNGEHGPLARGDGRAHVARVKAVARGLDQRLQVHEVDVWRGDERPVLAEADQHDARVRVGPGRDVNDARLVVGDEDERVQAEAADRAQRRQLHQPPAARLAANQPRARPPKQRAFGELPTTPTGGRP